MMKNPFQGRSIKCIYKKSSNYLQLNSAKAQTGKLHIAPFIEDSFHQFCTIGSLRERKLNSARE